MQEHVTYVVSSTVATSTLREKGKRQSILQQELPRTVLSPAHDYAIPQFNLFVVNRAKQQAVSVWLSHRVLANLDLKTWGGIFHMFGFQMFSFRSQNCPENSCSMTTGGFNQGA